MMNRRQLLLTSIPLALIGAKRPRPNVPEIEFKNNKITALSKLNLLKAWSGGKERVQAFLPANTKALIKKFTCGGDVSYYNCSQKEGLVEYLSFWNDVEVAIYIQDLSFDFYILPVQNSIIEVVNKFRGKFRELSTKQDLSLKKKYMPSKDILG